MSKSLLDRLLASIFDAEWTGKRGERLTAQELNLVRLLGRDGKVLRNVYVPKDNGETSEIDLLFITQKGIFVIESKNYSGWVFGDEKAAYWTVMLPNKEKNKLYNPIKQNRNHMKWLGRYLGDAIPLFSIVAFSERCELKNVAVESGEVKVIKRDRLYATVREIWESVPNALSEDAVTNVYGKLVELTNADAAMRSAHVAAINMKYKPSAKPAQTAPDVQTIKEERICPECGAPLVLRTAKKGAHIGQSFYGCSGFPKCRYIENL